MTCNTATGYTNILDLPRLYNIEGDDLIIVRNNAGMYTIPFDDFIIPIENTTFGGTISSHSLSLESISTNIDTLCAYLSSSIVTAVSSLKILNDQIDNVPVIDVNPTVAVNADNNTTIDTKSEILQSLSSNVACVPWRVVHVNKFTQESFYYYSTGDTNTSVNERSRLFTLKLSAEMTRSTNRSAMLVECKISHADYYDGSFASINKQFVRLPFNTVYFRLCRNGEPVGIPSNRFHACTTSKVHDWIFRPEWVSEAVTVYPLSYYTPRWSINNGASTWTPNTQPVSKIEFVDTYVKQLYLHRVVQQPDDITVTNFKVIDYLKDVNDTEPIIYTIEAMNSDYTHHTSLNYNREASISCSSAITITELI